MNPERVEKEEIGKLKFPDAEVLKSSEAMNSRLSAIEKAMKLGNLEHSKVVIVFEDLNGKKQVETTIWGVTDKRIILKGDAVIPIHRVHEIKI